MGNRRMLQVELIFFEKKFCLGCKVCGSRYTIGVEVLQPLVEEEQLSPSEYYEMVDKASKAQRKRAAGSKHKKEKGEPTW